MAENCALPKKADAVMALAAGFLGWLFAGLQLGLMPLAAPSVSRSLMGADYDPAAASAWFAYYTAAVMLGAATGGIVFGSVGDRFGRARGLAWSMFCYTFFGLAGYLAQTQDQLLALRFLAGLGIGGAWPNGVSLIAEFWTGVSRPALAGLMGAAVNLGVFLTAQLGKWYVVTPETWRPFMLMAGSPIIVALLALWLTPESPKWLASRGQLAAAGAKTPLGELFAPPLLRVTLIGICLGAIPLLGAWASSKWMLPWADQVAGATDPGYKAAVLWYWSIGATIGGLSGGFLGHVFGRRLSYFLISLGSCAMNLVIYGLMRPLEPAFLPLVFLQGIISTMFFGWLPLYLPELFPTRVRATGTGIAYNFGRFITAGGTLAAGGLVLLLDGDYAKAGFFTAFVYALGMLAIWFDPRIRATE